MNAKEQLEKFIEKYGEKIRAEYMPAVLLGGNDYVNEQYAANGILQYKYYSKIYTPYILYDKELDVLALAIGRMPSGKTAGSQREWTGEVYYIINHVKTLFDKNLVSASQPIGKCQYWRQKDFLSEFRYGTQVATKQLQEFLGESFRIGSRILETQMWCLESWFKKSDRKNDPTEIDKMGFVPEVEVDTADVDKMYTSWNRTSKIIITTTERYDIIRTFYRNKEINRIYFDTKTNKITIFAYTNGVWEKSTCVDNYAVFLVDKNLVDDYFQKTRRLKYLVDIITDNKEIYVHTWYDRGSHSETTNYIRVFVGELIKLLRYPIIEKLYKAGYKNTYKSIDISCPKASLLDMFGVYNKKSKTIHGAFGLSKFQLDFIEKETEARRGYRGSFSVLRKIKGGLDRNDISNINNEQFKTIYEFVSKIVEDRFVYNHQDFWREEETFVRDVAKFETVARRFSKISAEHDDRIYDLYNDMINIYRQCQRARLDVITLDVGELKCYNDLVRLHNYYTAIFNEYQEERRRNYDKVMKEQHEKLLKGYEKIYKERKQLYEYAYEDYMFVIPHDPKTELANEGRILGHCVGGYSDSVLSGSTNIVFLREKSAPEIPFMTIEVKNGRITQCHGSHNSWLGSSEKYIKSIPAVMHWLKDRGIKCHKNILTSKAMGYSGTNSGYINLPDVPFDVKEILE